MSALLTVVGNLTADPEIKFTAGGKAVASFTVATSERRRQDDGTWINGDSTYWPVSVWEGLAEHVCESLRKGDAVIVVGSASWRGWDKPDGTKGGRLEIKAREVAASLRWHPVVPARGNTGTRPSATQQDPWSADHSDDIPPF